MITKDRIQLNKRFCVAFKILEDRGIIIKNDRGGKGMGDFAERVLGNRGHSHIISAFLNDDSSRVINYSQARTFCREFGINESWMLDGSGSPLGAPIQKAATREDEDASFRKPNIIFTSVEAFAGPSVELSGFAPESADLFSLPGLTGNGLFAFPVKGNSMEPVIKSSDVVVCRQLENILEIKDNDIYAVKNNGSVWVKYVQKILNPKGQVHKLKLISANYLEHDPFIEEVNETTRIFKVVRKISGL